MVELNCRGEDPTQGELNAATPGRHAQERMMKPRSALFCIESRITPSLP